MECPNCKFVAAPGQVAEDGVCPSCERPYRSQPTPLNSDMEMRNMVEPGVGDMGGNPLQEGILGDYQNRGVRDESYASVRACNECGVDHSSFECPPEFEIEAVLPPDPESLRPDNKRTTMKHEAFLPLLGLLAGGSALLGGEGLAGAASAMAPSIAGSLIGHGLANTVLPDLTKGLTAGPEQAGQGQTVQGPDYYSSVAAPLTHFFGADEQFKSPGSTDKIVGDEDKDFDTKEQDDGDRELGLHVGPGVNDIGGTDQGAFSDEANQAITELLPKILQYALTPESGAHELSGLDQQLESEIPGYKDQADDGAAHKFVMMILKGNGEGEQPGGDEDGDSLTDNDAPHDPISDKAANLNICPNCQGALDPSTHRCPQCGGGNVLGGPQPVNTNQPPHIAAETQGPKTPEQKEAVAQLLIDQGRGDELQNMYEHPEQYADELSQITHQETPPTGPDPGSSPAPEEAPPEATMPMPGMQAPGPSTMGQPGMMASIIGSQVDGLAGKCPKCDSHSTGYLNEDGDCGCKTCGHEWSDDKLVGNGTRTADEHVQQHGDNFDNALGVDAADVRHQENPEHEQDSSHTWVDEQGQPLKVGMEYEMYSDKYDIPDMIRIEAVKPDVIEYTLTGEYGIEHRTEITHEEAQLENLHFVPAHDDGAELEDPGLEQNQDDIQRPSPGFEQTDLSQPHMTMSAVVPGEVAAPNPPLSAPSDLPPEYYTPHQQCASCGTHFPEGDTVCQGCGTYVGEDLPVHASTDDETGPEWLMEGVHTAGARFTPTEQRDFIDEEGVARNADKLNLQGTHYESRADSIADDQFLFGL